MVKAWRSVIVLLAVWATGQPLFSAPAAAQLSPTFYTKTCPSLFDVVEKSVSAAIKKETRIAASLLRLHFHDCFVQGCDGSVLLDNTTTTSSEFYTLPNQNSLRGFDTIDTIKAAVEHACPNVVSCADILALASFFSVVLSGGPSWAIPLGRRDSFVANPGLTTNLPGPSFTITQLKSAFARQSLTSTDLVSLSGGHTIGLARCTSLNSRLYNFNGTGNSDPSINSTLLKTLKKNCPNGGNGNVTNNMDIRTPTVFDNLYFKNLLQNNVVFSSDEVLLRAASDTAVLVKLYADNQSKFFADFAASMIKMGNLNVLTGKAGEVRKNCHKRNPVTIIEEEDRSESSLEKVVEGTENVLEGALDFVKDAVEKVMKDTAREELQNLTVEDTIDGGHSSM